MNIVHLINNNFIQAGFTKAPLNLSDFVRDVEKIHLYDGFSVRRVNQVHGIKIISSCDASPEAQADGIFTLQKKQLLITSHADCLPLFLYADGFYLLAHAGRAGVFSGISENAVDTAEKNGVSASGLSAVIGPGICKDCYEVSLEIAQQFSSRFPDSVKNRNLDLKKAVKSALLQKGLSESNITVSDQCTCHQKEYHSYRRDSTKLRNAAFLAVL